MNLRPFSRRGVLIGICAFLLSSLVLWWGLWTVASQQYRRTLDAWVDSGRAAGYEITYDDRKLFGFPRRVVYRFNNLVWKNADGISFHATNIDIGAVPWVWHKFHAKFKGHAELAAPLDQSDRKLVLSGESGNADVEIDENGFWTSSRINLSSATLGRAPDYIFIAESLKASAQRPRVPPKDHKEMGLLLTGQAVNVTLPNAMPASFGPKVAKFGVNLRVMDAVPDFRWKQSVDAWNKDSGVIEFDELKIDWGPLLVEAKGTMGFDDDLQPEGAFSSIIGHHQDVLKALGAAGFIAPRQEGMLTSAMSLFAKPTHVDGVAGIEVPIAVQLGGLFLGPVKIFSFPPIVWPDAPQTP